MLNLLAIAGLYIYYCILRPSIKWILHVVTQKSELERIVNGKLNASSVRAVEYALIHSRKRELRDLICIPVTPATVKSAVTLVVKAKYVPDNRQHWFVPLLKNNLMLICGYNQLAREVEWTRKVAFDKTDDSHEETLLHFWSLVKPDVLLENRISKQWQDCGFQGDDPATDFRGMGILGLQQLIFFLETYPAKALQVYSRSLHPQTGYPFAVAGINITGLCRDLLRKGHLKTHFYNQPLGTLPNLVHFHQIYCTVFCMFDQIWHQNTHNVMQFGTVRDELYKELEDFLSTSTATLNNSFK